MPGFNPTRALSLQLTWVRGPMMLRAAGLAAAVTLLGAAAVAATTPAECSRRMHGRRSLPPPPPVTPGAFDWIREIAAAGPGRKFTLQARTWAPEFGGRKWVKKVRNLLSQNGERYGFL